MTLDKLAVAIAKLRAASDLLTSQRAYETLLDAVGNNHAGTYDAAVLQAIASAPLFLHEAGPWACRALFEALIDLLGSFVPEPGHERYEGSDLRQLVITRVVGLRPLIEAVAHRSDASSESARELLALVVTHPTLPPP
jgi:hypothetical protein